MLVESDKMLKMTGAFDVIANAVKQSSQTQKIFLTGFT